MMKKINTLVLSFVVFFALKSTAQDTLVSDFSNRVLPIDSFWNGSDLSGKFNANLAVFHNSYDIAWSSWSGFAYSNRQDDSTAGYTNQYTAITAGGIEGQGSNYALAYVPIDFYVTLQPVPIKMTFADSSKHAISGFYVTNSTYAYFSMLNGDFAAKKFGGADGSDADFLRLLIYGKNYNGYSDTVIHYMADYSSSNNANDYIVNDWQWVDISSLGKVDTLYFTMESSDVGMFGINTPTYFCLDNIKIAKDKAPQVYLALTDVYSEVGNTMEPIVLSTVFTDADDPINEMQYFLVSNTNNESVEASIANDSLLLNFKKSGQAKLVLGAKSNAKWAYDTIMVFVSPTASIESILLSEFKVYPNPSSDYLVIDFKGIADVSFYNSIGSKVLELNHYAGGTPIYSITSIATGVYTIKLTKENRTYTLKMIKR